MRGATHHRGTRGPQRLVLMGCDGPARWCGRLRRELRGSLRVALVCSAALIASCTPGEATGQEDLRAVSIIEPVTPTGTVSGYVEDALTGSPLAGVRVVILSGSSPLTADTGDDGTFRIDGVPASTSIALRYDIDGYVQALDIVTIPSSAGNLAQDNGVAFSGPVGLLPAAAGEGGAIGEAVVFGADGAVHTEGISLQAQLGVAFFVAGVAQGSIAAEVSVAEGGERFVLGGFPDLAQLAAVAPDAILRLVVAPAAGLGFVGELVETTVADLLRDGFVEIVLDDAPVVDGLGGGGLEILDSNVLDLVDGGGPLLPSLLASTEEVEIGFSQRIDESTAFVSAVNEDGDEIPVQLFTEDNPNVRIQFLQANALGQEVNLFIDVFPEGHALSGEEPFSKRGAFFVQIEGGVLQLETTGRLRAVGNSDLFACPDQVAELELTLNGAVGARRLLGGVAVAVVDGGGAATYLPIVIESSGVPAGERAASGRARFRSEDSAH